MALGSTQPLTEMSTSVCDQHIGSQPPVGQCVINTLEASPGRPVCDQHTGSQPDQLGQWVINTLEASQPPVRQCVINTLEASQPR